MHENFVLIRSLSSFLAVVIVGLAGWLSIRFLRRRRVTAPAAGRPLYLLVILPRPVVRYSSGVAEQQAESSEMLSEVGASPMPVASSGTALSYESLEQALIKVEAPISVRYLHTPTMAALAQAVGDGFDALLFDGYGLEDGSLAFEDPFGEQHVVTPGELGHCLQGTATRLVWLGTCYSAQRARGLRQAGVVAVGGMAGAARRDAAAAFVADLFAALARGQNVRRALTEGRKGMAVRFGASAEEEAAPQLSAWRWPALRLVQPGASAKYEGSPPLPSPAPPVVELVGRAMDIVLVNRQFAHSRLVTLVGPGGVGKTALAKAVAHWHWRRGLDSAGVRFISLETLRSGRDLADELLCQLVPDYQPSEGQDATDLLQYKLERLSACLSRGKWLLVLDNFESVLDAEAVWTVQELLGQCQELHLLLTAPESTALAQELTHPVKPLIEGPAVELFCQRAKQPVPGHEREGVAAICRILDNIPLAIELVARHRDETLAVTLDQLQQAHLQLSEASEAGEGEPAAHRERIHGLLVSLHYSYGRLDEEARSLFCAFTVFRGGATREALSGVMGGLLHWERALEELLDRRLLEQESTDGTWRYRMLPVVTEYAEECFRRDAARLELDEAAVRRRHAEYYLRLVRQEIGSLVSTEERREAIVGPAQRARLSVKERPTKIEQAALAVLEGERANLLAAVEGAYRTRVWDLVWRLVQELARGLDHRSFWTVGERVHLLALRAARQAGDPRGEGQMLVNLGQVYTRQGHWGQAVECYEQYLAICRELGDHNSEGETQASLGHVYFEQGRRAEAAAALQKSRQIFRQLGNLHSEGQTLANLGDVYFRQDRWVEAAELYRESLQIRRRLEDRRGEGQMRINLGIICRLQGRWAEASALFQEGVRIFHTLGDGPSEGQALNNLGLVYTRQGRWDEANACYEQYYVICREKGDHVGEGQAVSNLGLVYADQGRWAEAIAMFRESLHIFRDSKHSHGEGQVLNNLGQVYAGQRRWDEAIAVFEKSRHIFRELDRHYEGQTLCHLGRVYAGQNRWGEARAIYQEGLSLFRQLGDRHGEGQALFNLADAYFHQDRWIEATSMYQESLAIFRELGAHHSEGQALVNLGLVYVHQARWVEALAMYRESLPIFRQLGDRHSEGQAIDHLGGIYVAQGHWAKAIACYEQYLAICRELGDRHCEGKTLNNLGQVYTRQARWVEAILMYQESLPIFRQLGDRQGEGETLNNLGLLYAHQARWDEAISVSQESLQIFRQLGDRRNEGRTLNNLGQVYANQGYWVKALAMYREGLRVCRELEDRQSEGKALTSLGDIHHLQGRWAEAIECYRQSLAICQELGDRYAEGQMLSHLGLVHTRQGCWAEAIEYYEQYLVVCRELGDLHGEGQTLAKLGGVYFDQGHWDEAQAMYQQSLRICRELGDRQGEGKALMSLGLLCARRGEEGMAAAWWYRALVIFEALKAPEVEQIWEWLRRQREE